MTEDQRDLAIHWMLRRRAGDMDEAEWDALIEWLEQSPEHAQLLDQAQAADDDLAALSEAGEHASEVPVADNENEPEVEAANDNQLRRFLPFGGIIAAAIAVFALWPASAPDTIFITTQPGETRIVALNDDITMRINGDSSVSYIAEDTLVAVTGGEVAFEIDADEPSPLRVEVAGLSLTDYGTIFNVVLDDENVRIAVAEGIVGINPEAENISVNAGEQVTQSLSGGALVREEVDTETVGSWAEGRLEFDDTPALDAVAMLERSIGSKVTLAEALQEERLTGSLIIAEDEQETVTQFAAFLDARARRGRLAGYGMVWDVR